MANEKLDTNQKARQINLDANRYGTFAEIGAGQEVARWFFRAGGAARTVAKTISAYDMAISDAIYGLVQRHERMDLIARSMMLKGSVSLTASAGCFLPSSALGAVTMVGPA